MLGHRFPFIEVSGTSYEMGYAYGAQARALIGKYILWIEMQSGASRVALAERAMAFLPLMQRLSPRFVEEVHGLADGAELSFGEALLCQARMEAANVASEGCTAFAVTRSGTADHQPLAGQNQDMPPEMLDLAIVVRLKPSDGRPRAVMLTFAGQLGYHGMNQHGVAQFANQLYNYEWRLGLPHYPLKRAMLEQASVGECLALFERHRVCSAGNVVVCDGNGEIADIEVRPEQAVVFPDQEDDLRLHTNHYLVPEFTAYETHTLPDSCPRLDRMRTLIKENWGAITVERMKLALADHDGHPSGICRHGGEGLHSICGYIAEPGKGLFHVRFGHGCLGTWQSYAV
jgi:hypothetical protein